MLNPKSINGKQFEKEAKQLLQLIDKENLSNDKLQALVELVSVCFFDRPFKHKATFNSRLRTTGGRYHLSTHHLDFNPKVYEKLGMEEFIKVIKHELCHYHLHLLGMGYRHRDIDFKNWLAWTGGSRFVPRMDEEEKAYNYTYECISCYQIFKRQRRVSVKRYRCPCGGTLHLKESCL